MRQNITEKIAFGGLFNFIQFSERPEIERERRSRMGDKEKSVDATTQASPQYSKDEKAEIATALGVVYVGMPREDLLEVYSKEMLKGSYKQDNEEWLTFSDWTTEERRPDYLLFAGWEG